MGVGQAAPCSLNWETGPDMPALQVTWTAEDLHAEAQATSFKNETDSSREQLCEPPDDSALGRSTTGHRDSPGVSPALASRLL